MSPRSFGLPAGTGLEKAAKILWCARSRGASLLAVSVALHTWLPPVTGTALSNFRLANMLSCLIPVYPV
jgi:hypothetical protein